MAIEVPVKPIESQRRRGPLPLPSFGNKGKSVPNPVKGRRAKELMDEGQTEAPPVQWIRY